MGRDKHSLTLLTDRYYSFLSPLLLPIASLSVLTRFPIRREDEPTHPWPLSFFEKSKIPEWKREEGEDR